MVVMTVALCAGGLLACFGAAAHDLAAHASRFEQDRPALEDDLAELLAADLMRHLPEDGPWSTQVDEAQLERVRAEHWSALIRPGEGGNSYRVRADSFVQPVDEPVGPFAEALPAIRVIDLFVSLHQNGDEDPRVEIQAAGARLDDAACDLLRAYFEGTGVIVLIASSQVGH